MTKTVSKNQYADSRDFMTSLLFRKWTIAIILSLGAETKRYSALHRSLPGVTQKVLTEHLKQLERAGIVRRFFYPTIPPRVEYEQSFLLTCERGDALLIADQNHVAVKVVAAEKEHPLITTNPAELYSS